MNGKYIRKLLKLSPFTTVKQTVKELGFTHNCFNLKLLGGSKIYIHEAVLIAKELKTDIMDVFYPSEQLIADVLLHDKLPYSSGKIDYNIYNFNSEYIKSIMSEKNVTFSDIAKVWKIQVPGVYVKFRGHKPKNGGKITVERAIMLSNLLEMNINYLFCPTKKEIIEQITKKSFEINPETKIQNLVINKETLDRLCEEKNIELNINKLIEPLDLSYSTIKNKLLGQTKISFRESILLCDYLGVDFDELFKED